MSFRESICEHLAKYKVDVLGVEEDGIFHSRGRNVTKSHILPVADKQQRGELNILRYRGARFFEGKYSRIKLHQFFHHLNSSQAMCINLFYPLIEERKLDLVTSFLGMEATGEIEACFEKESEMEQAVRRTNFDFHLRCPPIKNIFFEVKYTEDRFGAAKADPEHCDKFRTLYSGLVAQALEFLSERCLEESFFLGRYQILRNLVHLDSSSYVVFLFPSANLKIKQQALDARQDALTDAGRRRVKIALLEKVVTFLEVRCQSDSLASYYREFRAKYLPPSLT